MGPTGFAQNRPRLAQLRQRVHPTRTAAEVVVALLALAALFATTSLALIR